MGSAGIDFNVAFEAFLKWLSVTFGGGCTPSRGLGRTSSQPTRKSRHPDPGE